MYTPNSTLISFLPHVYARVHNPREGIKKSKIFPKMVGVYKFHYISQVNTKIHYRCVKNSLHLPRRPSFDFCPFVFVF